MEVAHLEHLAELDETYWWHVAKRRLVRKLLLQHAPPPGRLVEGGIGSSRNLLEFQEMGYEVHGFDLFEESTVYARERGIENAVVHDLAEPWPIPPQTCRAIVLLDVIEHVADPVAVLRNASSALETDGAVIVTVPAHRWLYGEWDRRLGHFRRYTRRLLREQADDAALDVTWLSYWNSFTFPAAVCVRAWQRLFPKRQPAEFPDVSPFTNRVLLGMANVERSAVPHLRIPLGLSLVAVLRRRAEDR